MAIGRAIVRNPQVLLMDEPLSNLDAKLRNQMRAEIIKLRQKINTTFIYVTHDQTEAMTLGDRIVIMKDGEVQQIGTPQEVFGHPNNLFVAGFIGTPQMNFFNDCQLTLDNDEYAVTVMGTRIALTRQQQEILFNGVWEDYPEMTNRRERMKCLRQDIYYNALQIKYAYAVTCHKAQGGQWEHVYIDQGYITEEMLTPDYFRWLYTAITRATEQVYLVNWPDSALSDAET